jgi:hypothetical protein
MSAVLECIANHYSPPTLLIIAYYHYCCAWRPTGLCGVKMTSHKQMIEHFMTSGHLTVAAGVKQALAAIEELGAM